MNCKTCKWWDINEIHFFSGEYTWCIAPHVFYVDFEGDDEEAGEVGIADRLEWRADGLGVEGDMPITGAEFGCIRWEARE